MDEEEFEGEEFEEEEEDLDELDPEALEDEETDLEADLDEEDTDEAALEEDETVLLEEEEQPDTDEIEASLDQILEERVGVRAGVDDDEEDGDFDDGLPVEDRTSPVGVAPKRPGEFTCRSCFLVKHPSQLADPDRMLCRDCV